MMKYRLQPVEASRDEQVEVIIRWKYNEVN
jgi:hypothetical protein